MIELTEDQVRALKSQTKGPLQVLNPCTQEIYVLIRQDVYQLTSRILSGPNQRGWDDPELDVYEEFQKEAMNRGDVVLVDWVYSDLTGSKLRPAVVVQADFLNSLIDDVILVQITGTRHGIPGTEVEIDPAREPGTGLKKASYVSCTNILTYEKARIDQTIGRLPAALLRQIENCLKKVMEIP